MIKILILKPNSQEGQPVFERTKVWIDFYISYGLEVSVVQTPRNVYETFKIIVFIYKMRIQNVFITIPPFKNWVLVLLLYIHIVLYIRDYLSMEIRSSYSGTLRSNKINYFLAPYIEKIAIKGTYRPLSKGIK